MSLRSSLWLKSNFLDLWMVHDMSMNDLDVLFGPKGTVKAFEVAERNKVKYYARELMYHKF